MLKDIISSLGCATQKTETISGFLGRVSQCAQLHESVLMAFSFMSHQIKQLN